MSCKIAVAIKWRFVVALMVLCQCLISSSVEAAEKRVALVIGNAAYRTSPLTNPVNDARDMAAALRQLDFDVIEKTDATQKEMLRAIIQFGEKLRSDSVALFFYAGHGMQVKGKNFLVPVDAQIASEASVRAETVDVDSVMDQLSVSALNIVILDACRNNPFERRFRSVGGGLAQMDAPKGSLIAYGTAPGKTAADGEGRNGLYTQEILKHIRVPGLSVETVFKRVRNGVMQGSGDAQTPWESSSLTGEFFFKPGNAVQPAPVTATTTAQMPQTTLSHTAEQIEDELWESIRNSDKPAVFEEYVRGYPKGRHVTQAKVKLAGLKEVRNLPAGTAPIPRDDAETALWKAAESSQSREDYRAYLSKYRMGKYAALATARIDVIDSNARAQHTEAAMALPPGKPIDHSTPADIKQASEKGMVSAIVTSRGTSNEADILTRRNLAQKMALNSISKKLSQLLTHTYGLSKDEASAIFASGEIVGAELFNDAKEVEIQYKVVFQKAGR